MRGYTAMSVFMVLLLSLFAINLTGCPYIPNIPGNEGEIITEGEGEASITPQNHVPVAEAGADQSARLGKPFTLNGSLSIDADGDTLSYAWSLLSMPIRSNATLSGVATATPQFIPDVEGSYTAQLVVSDGKANSAPDTVRVTVGTVLPAEGEGDPPVEGEPSPGATETILLPGNVPLEMVWIPAGTFTMGSPDNEQDRWSSEGPQHSVTLSTGFWMGKYELTQAQWKAVMGGANPSHFQGANAGNVTTDNRPVEQVSWDAITQTFLPALNAVTGLSFRLPTEAQWEYAARAGTQTRFYWGDDPDYTEIGSYAWYWDNNTPSGTKDVGGKLANNFGLYDMSGNVWEWVEDDMHWDYTGASLDGSAWVDNPRGSYRVIRGGSWDSYGDGCRSAHRDYGTPSGTYIIMGFRLSR